MISHRVSGAALAALLCLPLTAVCGESLPACDRACLGGLLTRYVDALVARDPAGLPLAENVRVTEDSRSIKLGEGLWKSVTGKATFRQDYLDVRKQVAAAHVVLPEGANQALYSVLLHVRDGRIGGIETLVQRITPESRFQPTELGKPIRGTIRCRRAAGSRASR